MRPLLAAPALAAALLAATHSGAAYESALDDVEAQVRDSYAIVTDGLVGRDAAVEALGRALGILERPCDSTTVDARRAWFVARLLQRRWSDSGLFPAFEAAMAADFPDLGARVAAEVEALEAWTGKTGDARREERLAQGLAAARRWLAFGDASGRVRYIQARYWFRASRAVRWTRRLLRLDAPSRPPFRGLAPDFLLEDRNPNSPTSGAGVSPRDHRARVTAWYFTLAT